MEMETLFLVSLHNHAHEGYFRARRRLSKGEQVVEISASQCSQLASDPRITILSVSEVQPETPDTCDGESRVVASELVSGSVTSKPPLMPSHYAPVISDEIKPSADLAVKAKPSRKKS